MEKNIVLCGFMGCGKTTLGPLLAEALHMEFVDMDKYIEERAGMTIPEIFTVHGEAGFRDREHDAILALSARRGLVLSTGGGALTVARNIPPLRDSGVVLYLNAGFDECYRRIAHSDRPLVHRHTREELAALYLTRQKTYRAAAHHELTLSGAPDVWVRGALEILGKELG